MSSRSNIDQEQPSSSHGPLHDLDIDEIAQEIFKSDPGLRYLIGSPFKFYQADNLECIDRCYFNNEWYVSGDIVRRTTNSGDVIFSQIIKIFRGDTAFLAALADLFPVNESVCHNFSSMNFQIGALNENLHNIRDLKIIHKSPKVTGYFDPMTLNFDSKERILLNLYKADIEEERIKKINAVT